MSLIALDPRATTEYSLKFDTGDDKTVFIVGQLDAFTAANITDRLAKYSLNNNGSEELASISLNKNELDVDTVRLGLKGWRNLQDKDGNEVQFKTASESFKGLGNREVASKDSIKRLRSEWIKELADAIRGENVLTEQETKNSGGPSR